MLTFYDQQCLFRLQFYSLFCNNHSFDLAEGYPEKQEEETLEKWRERCREKEKSVVLNAGKLLMDSNQDNFETVNLVLTGRVPTIKFLHKKTGIKCDLTFKVRDVGSIPVFGDHSKIILT